MTYVKDLSEKIKICGSKTSGKYSEADPLYGKYSAELSPARRRTSSRTVFTQFHALVTKNKKVKLAGKIKTVEKAVMKK